MSDTTRAPLVEKKSVQIAILVLAVCAALWALFFPHGWKETIIFAVVSVCLREAFAKSLAVLDKSEEPRYLQFKRLFRAGSVAVILLPSFLEKILHVTGDGASLKYGSSLTLICALYLVRAPLSLLLFGESRPSEDISA